MTVDQSMPWGIYVQSSVKGLIGEKSKLEVQQEDDEVLDVDVLQHIEDDGYIRIIDAKGKFFQCGFSRPVGFEVKVSSTSKKKRSHSQMMVTADTSSTKPDAPDYDVGSENVGADGNDGIVLDAAQSIPGEKQPTDAKKTITEERIHPEEALFLHMRGLLRIETLSQPSNKPVDDSTQEKESSATINCTMSTQDLFTKMLPECNIPLAAYLAYAHLRAQGYNLIRYSGERLGLLGEMLNMKKRQHNGDDTSNSLTTLKQSNPQLDIPEQSIDKEESAIQINNEDGHDDASKASTTANTRYSKERQLKTRLSDDVATAPPPSIASPGDSKSSDVHIAYYAYNPNARFRRSNPGLPDFGVAVMPFHSDNVNGPTFDVLKSLVAACEGRDQLLNKEDGSDDGKQGNENGSTADTTGIPLRVVTVADSGAVIAFGVTTGDVPSIKHAEHE